MNLRWQSLARGLLLASIGMLGSGIVHADDSGVRTLQFKNKVRALTFEILDDRTFHFEYSIPHTAVDPNTNAIKTSPFIKQTQHDGPESFSVSGNSFQTEKGKMTSTPPLSAFAR